MAHSHEQARRSTAQGHSGCSSAPGDDAAGSQRGRMEAQQRKQQRLDVRVVIRAGVRPQQGQANQACGALEALLKERLRMPEKERQRTMQQVQRVLVLPGGRGCGKPLLATFGIQPLPQQTGQQRRRASNQSLNAKGPEATGHGHGRGRRRRACGMC